MTKAPWAGRERLASKAAVAAPRAPNVHSSIAANSFDTAAVAARLAGKVAASGDQARWGNRSPRRACRGRGGRRHDFCVARVEAGPNGPGSEVKLT